MIDKSHFGRIINLLLNVALGIVLSSVGLLLAHKMTPMIFVQSFVVSMGVGYTICDLIPAPIWGQKLAQRLKIKNKMGFHLFSTAIGGFVLITCISFFCQFVAVGSIVFQVWPYALPYLFFSGYLVLIIFLPIFTKISDRLTRDTSAQL